MNKIICKGLCKSPHLYILLHNMVFTLIFITNISIATNDEQKCFESNQTYHLCQVFFKKSLK